MFLGISCRLRRTNVREVTDTLDFTCPRCGGAASDRFYGPCGSCRSELRASLGSEGKVLDEVEFVPKMNVTPNAVALKDD